MKKIALNKETLRKLDDVNLKKVIGGGTNPKSNKSDCYATDFPIGC